MRKIPSLVLFIVCVFGFSAEPSFGQTVEKPAVAPELHPTPAPVAPPVDKPVELGRTSQEIENDKMHESHEMAISARDLSIGGELSILGIAIPTKYGPFISYRSDNWVYEAQWFGGSISLDTSFFSIGSVKENLLIAQARRFVGKSSFNWIFGLSQQTYEASVGQDILVNTTGHPTSAELIKVRTLGAQLGLGNRWQLENGLMIGADWLVLNVPFMGLESSVPILDYTNDQNTKDRVNDAVKILRYIPTFALAKVQLGYSF